MASASRHHVTGSTSAKTGLSPATPGPTACEGEDSSEPNDDLASATALGFPGTWDAIPLHLCPGDPDFWNAPFGAVLVASKILSHGDPVRRGVDFLETGLRALTGGDSGRVGTGH